VGEVAALGVWLVVGGCVVVGAGCVVEVVVVDVEGEGCVVVVDEVGDEVGPWTAAPPSPAPVWALGGDEPPVPSTRPRARPPAMTRTPPIATPIILGVTFIARAA
jgi:hypothetical protein